MVFFLLMPVWLRKNKLFSTILYPFYVRNNVLTTYNPSLFLEIKFLFYMLCPHIYAVNLYT